MPRNIRAFFMYGGEIENSWRKVRVTTEKMAKIQLLSSMFFCFKCFTDLLIPLPNNQRVDFEEEESINYFEQKCVCYGFYK